MSVRGTVVGARTMSRAVAAGGLAVVVTALTSCTAATGTPDRAAPTRTAGATVPSGPTMTAIEEAARCTTHRVLGADEAASIPRTDVFVAFVAGGGELPDETRLGPDGADPDRCPGELPEEAWCGQGAPWAGLGWNDFLTASGATRGVRSEVLSVPAGSSEDAGSGSRENQSFSYREYDLRAGDPKGLSLYLRAAFDRCSEARPTTIHGLEAMVGAVPSEQGARHEAECVLFLTPSRVAWVLLDGRAWTPEERAHALKVTSSRLA